MSKVLKISKHKLDLALVELTGPSIIIGRSPLCDHVLRAPGIKPLQYLLEWIGEGEFDPDSGMWTLFDMGDLVDSIGSDVPTEEELKFISGEGFIISDIQQHHGLNWTIIEDALLATNIQKGIITEQLKNSHSKIAANKKLVLEIVCLSKKDQKVDDIWHFFDQEFHKTQKHKTLPFDVNWKQKDNASIVFHEEPVIVFQLNGTKVENIKNLEVSVHESFIIHFRTEVYLVRFVGKVDFNANSFSLKENKFWILNFLFLSLFCFFLWSIKNSEIINADKVASTELRIIKIVEPEVIKEKIPEVKPEEPIVKVEEEIIKKEELKIEPPKEVINEKFTAPIATEVVKAKVKEKIATSEIKAKFLKKKINIEKSSHNELAKISDINAVGLLGRMKNKGNNTESTQISAESISQTFIDDTARSNDNKGVLIKTAQMGIIGNKNLNLDKLRDSGGNSNLLEAQTTLQGAKGLSSKIGGPLAINKSGFNNGFESGSDSETKIARSAEKLNRRGSIGGEGSEVSGGLTKAEVYNVIYAHRRAVRTCFESGLLVRNDISGTLQLSFIISMLGTVTDIKIISTELNSSILESCVVQIIRQMKFPESANQQPTKVLYPFVFKRSF